MLQIAAVLQSFEDFPQYPTVDDKTRRKNLIIKTRYWLFGVRFRFKRSQLDAPLTVLAIQVGDSMGFARPVPNVHTGDKLKMRSGWITKDKAYSHCGEKMSVRHFTHHHLGFVCNIETCCNRTVR